MEYGKKLVDQRNRFGIRKLSVGVSVVCSDLFLEELLRREEQAEGVSFARRTGLLNKPVLGDQEGETVNRAPEQSSSPQQLLARKEIAQPAKGQKPLSQPLL